MQLIVIDVIDVAIKTEKRVKKFRKSSSLQLQFELLVPFGAKGVWLNGSCFDDFRWHWTHRVAMLTLSLEAQPEAAVFT